MPLYEYECCKCKQIKEVLLKTPTKMEGCSCGYFMKLKVSGFAKTPKKWEVDKK